MALNNKIKKDEFISIFRNNTSTQTLADKNDIQDIEKTFAHKHFPRKSDEEWRHTNINSIFQHKFSVATDSTLSRKTLQRFTIPGFNAYKFVFVNGCFVEQLSDIQDIDNKFTIVNTKYAKHQYPDVFKKYFGISNKYSSNLFTDINTAYATDGTFIFINENVEIDKYIHIINLSDGDNRKVVSQYRNIIVAKANSKLNILHTFHSLSVNYTFTNVVNEIILEENANINYNIFQGEGNDTFQLNNTRVLQSKHSKFSSHTITLCGSVVRNDINAIHLGEACETNLNGLYLPDREQHFDNNLFVHHSKAHGVSNQLYKGIIDNKASAVFLGKVLVEKGAQKTLANQSNRNVLLSDNAKVNSKPQLEIYADDVACSHGSTTGQIDQKALFYLQSRGIERKHAETLLLNAFLSDVIDGIESEALRSLLHLMVNMRLKGELSGNQCAMANVCQGCEV